MARPTPNRKKKGKSKSSKSKAAAGSSSSREDAGGMAVDQGSAADAQKTSSGPQVWQPSVDDVAEGEELIFDPSAYDCLHAFRLPWPCLSFDVVRDEYGDSRKQFPHTLMCVTGTQAASVSENTVSVIRLANLTRMRQRRAAAADDDGSASESSSSSSEEEEYDEDAEGGNGGAPGSSKSSRLPRMQVRSVAHHGVINRIRCMPQRPEVCATWGDTGRVQLWDLTLQIRQLAEEGTAGGPSRQPAGAIARQAPAQIFGGHSDEGFALDWSPVVVGRLATGDCKGGIFKWDAAATPGAAKWSVDPSPFQGHEGSVEDIQWSPSEAEVFASASVDGHICIWDARASPRHAAALRIRAHDADVNVISWNRLASCMVASGCDDGSFRIWDLRSLSEGGFIAHFRHHRHPITAIEWSPHESSMLAASCADNQTSIWDLALERDAEEEAEFEARQQQPQARAPEDLPPQLLFQHMGQHEVKESHWHPQIPGMLLSTAADGFNVFKPANL